MIVEMSLFLDSIYVSIYVNFVNSNLVLFCPGEVIPGTFFVQYRAFRCFREL